MSNPSALVKKDMPIEIAPPIVCLLISSNIANKMKNVYTGSLSGVELIIVNSGFTNNKNDDNKAIFLSKILLAITYTRAIEAVPNIIVTSLVAKKASFTI